MIDVRAAIDEVRHQTEDEAYWKALEKVLGRVTARTLRATLGTKFRGEGLTEREKVSRGLTGLLTVPTRFVEGLAKTEADDRSSHLRDDALRDLGVHEHWIDFSEPSEQAERTIPFVTRGLARGAKVIALLSSEVIHDYRQEISRAGHEANLRDGSLAVLSADQHVDILKTAGVVAVVLLAIQGLIQAARGQGYQEVWFVSQIAPALLSASSPSMDLIVRFEAGLAGLVQAFPITILCPFPTMLPGNRATFSDLVHANTWASVAEEALDVRSAWN